MSRAAPFLPFAGALVLLGAALVALAGCDSLVSIERNELMPRPPPTAPIGTCRGFGLGEVLSWCTEIGGPVPLSRRPHVHRRLLDRQQQFEALRQPV